MCPSKIIIPSPPPPLTPPSPAAAHRLEAPPFGTTLPLDPPTDLLAGVACPKGGRRRVEGQPPIHRQAFRTIIILHGTTMGAGGGGDGDDVDWHDGQ